MPNRDATELVQKSGRGAGNAVRIEITENLLVRVVITSPTGNNVDTAEFPIHSSAFELASWLECHQDY